MKLHTKITNKISHRLGRYGIVACLSALVANGLTAQDQDALLYEGFDTNGDYVVGSLDEQLTVPTPGATGDWSEDIFEGTRDIIAEGLTYTDGMGAELVTDGGALQLLPGARARRSIDTSGAFSEYSLFGSIGAVTGKTLYIAVLLKHGDMLDETAELSGAAFLGMIGGGSTSFNTMAVPDVSVNTFGSEQYFLRPYNNNSLQTAFGASINDVANLWVLKVEFVDGDNNDVISVYLNPDLSSEDANTPGVVFDSGDFTFDTFEFARFRDVDDVPAIFDEFRIGDTWASVTPHSPGTGDSWYGYSVDSNGWVDTGDWMSWLNVTFDPWIWSLVLDKYVYIADDSGWVFVQK